MLILVVTSDHIAPTLLDLTATLRVNAKGRIFCFLLNQNPSWAADWQVFQPFRRPTGSMHLF